MGPRERSRWTLGVMLVTFGLVAGSAFLPWFTYHHSSGQTAPPGTGSEDGSVERKDISFSPFAARGNLSDEQRADGRSATRLLGWLVSGALVLSFANLVIEAIAGVREGTRRVQLALTVLGFLVVIGAVAWSWFALPALLADEGVDGPFTSRNDSDTFVTTTLAWGWILAAVSLLGWIATFAFKFAGGMFDVAFIDRYDTRGP